MRVDISFVDCDSGQVKLIAEFMAGALALDYGRLLAGDPTGTKHPDPPSGARAPKRGITPAQKANEVAFDIVAPPKAASTAPVVNLLD